jgi:hypothetical protein
MASELRVNTLKDASGNNSVATSFVANGSAKAWLNQSQNNTINDSLNISGLTDNGVGDCTFAFASVMANINHSLLGVMNSGGNAANIMIIHNAMATASGRCRFGNYAGSGNSFTPFDDNSVKNTTHGDLA